ncbi:MAG: hypothetical protein ACREA0_32175, partial [bacterium]
AGDADVATATQDTNGATDADSSVVGTYDCGLEGRPTREVWELKEGNALTVTPKESGPKPEEGTWSMEDGRVIINFSGADDDPFNVDGDRLVFAGEKGPDGLWVCTRKG